jgi:ribose 5-phosphate isomerase A
LHWREEAKKGAALKAVKLIEDGQIIGLGTGSTVYYAIEELGRRVREEELNILGVSTSTQSTSLAQSFGVPLTTLNVNPQVNIAIDGADQVDFKLDMIKGMGGALTREKIVDGIAKSLVIIVDESKLNQKLGVNQVVPLEVFPFANMIVMQRIIEKGGKPAIRYLPNKTPFITDNGNYIVDVDFGEINNCESLEREVKKIPGVVEVGLFVNMAHIVYVGYRTKIEKIIRRVNK